MRVELLRPERGVAVILLDCSSYAFIAFLLHSWDLSVGLDNRRFIILVYVKSRREKTSCSSQGDRGQR